MKRHSYSIVGALFSAAVLIGTFVGASAPVGGSTLNLLPTSTSVKFVNVACTDNYDCATITATVSLEAVTGLLVTPTGSVSFNNAEYGPLGTATLSTCLLGLPSIL
jgi:hypothetical protein